jgi:hypothetical protein
MFTRYFKKALIPLLALVTILACGPFAAATPQPAATLNALYTSAAETLNAMSTQGSFTATAQPFVTPTLVLSSPTGVVVGVNTFTAVPPIQVTRCDEAAFIDDITYPDGSVIPLGSTFTKIWRIRNIGTCTWNTSYDLVFVSGERFGAPHAVALPGTVSPGQSVDLSVNLTSPSDRGNYIGYWKLRNASGVLFGMGTADASIYVDVKIAGYTVTGYDFLANFCDARWTNGSGDDLPCPGTQGDNNGFVVALDSPKMENNRSIGNGLLTYPEKGNNGLITGKYPNVRIEAGDRFQASLGCLYNANDCDMIYRLQYQIGNGDIRTLGQWREIYEGEYNTVSIDLSFLKGQRVKFIFTVLANGSSHEDFALWITPRITRQSSEAPTVTPNPSPTGTATPTATATSSYP